MVSPRGLDALWIPIERWFPVASSDRSPLLLPAIEQTKASERAMLVGASLHVCR